MQKSNAMRSEFCNIGCVVYCYVLTSCVATSTSASISWSVAFDDPSETYSQFYTDIVSHTLAAGSDWANAMDASLTASLEVIVGFDPNLATATGTSVTSSFVENDGVYDIFEQGAAAELSSGIDPNGVEPDVRITLGTSYLLDTLWFYSDPFNRIEDVPSNKIEAYKTFAHELGHALAFNGWRDPFDGTLPADYASPFDALTSFDGSNFYFNGPMATDLYGSPVPLTYGNSKHIGNQSPRPGDDLLGDLMNGVVSYLGQQYSISPLDLAIAFDVGLPVVQFPNPLGGDLDGDSDVDGADFLAWQRGDSDSPLSAEDLAMWYENFGTLLSLEQSAHQVPESPALVLLCCGTSMLLLRRARVIANP